MSVIWCALRQLLLSIFNICVYISDAKTNISHHYSILFRIFFILTNYHGKICPECIEYYTLTQHVYDRISFVHIRNYHHPGKKQKLYKKKHEKCFEKYRFHFNCIPAVLRQHFNRWMQNRKENVQHFINHVKVSLHWKIYLNAIVSMIWQLCKKLLQKSKCW